MALEPSSEDIVMDTLPQDVLTIIFDSLSMLDIINAQMVSRRWHKGVLASINHIRSFIPWMRLESNSENVIYVLGALKHCTNIRTLNLQGTFSFSGTCGGLNSWKRLKRDVEVTVSETALAKDPKLLSRSQFDASKRLDISIFKTFHRLESLDLSDNPALGDEVLDALIEADFPNLTHLDMSLSGYWRSLDPMSLGKICQFLSKQRELRHLYLQNIDISLQSGPKPNDLWKPRSAAESSEDEDEHFFHSSAHKKHPNPDFDQRTASFLADGLVDALSGLHKLESLSLPDWISKEYWHHFSHLSNLKFLIVDGKNELVLARLARPKVDVSTWVKGEDDDLNQLLACMETIKANVVFDRGQRGKLESLLHLAARLRSSQLVDYLLSLRDRIASLNPNARDIQGYTPLMCVASKPAASSLIAAGADVNAVTVCNHFYHGNSALRVNRTKKMTPLLCAVASGNTSVISYLIECGASQVAGTVSPLLAVRQPNNEVLHLLVKSYPTMLNDTSCYDLFRFTLTAFQSDNLDTYDAPDDNEALRLVMSLEDDKFKKLIQQRDESDITLLHHISAYARASHLPFIEKCLLLGADLNARDFVGLNPLWFALNNSIDEEVLKKVLEFCGGLSPELNARGSEPRSCLGVAAGHRYRYLFTKDWARFDASAYTCDPIPALYEICRVWTPEEVRELLHHYGTEIDVSCSSNQHGMFPIFAALGKPEMVELLLEHKVQLNVKDHFGTPLLMLASPSELKRFLELGAWPNVFAETVYQFSHQALIARTMNQQQMSMSKHTPLSYACWKGDVETAQLLLEHGAHPNLRAPDGPSAMDAILQQPEPTEVTLELLQLLLKYGADPNAIGQRNCCPLAEVIRWGSSNKHGPKLVRELLSAGAIPPFWIADSTQTRNRTEKETLSPSCLTIAISWHFELPLIETILDRSPLLISQPGVAGGLPLGMVCSGSYHSVPEFIMNGENSAQQSVKGFESESTILQEEIDLAKLLLSRGADPRMRDRENNNSIEYCIRHNRRKLLKILVDHDRQVRSEEKDLIDIVDLECNSEDMTPLSRAADLENSEIITLLLDLGAQINKPSASSFALDSVTALHLAVIADNYGCVKLLLERGADVTALSRKRTPLQEALNRRVVVPRIIKLLLDYKSDISVLTESQKKKLEAVQGALENSERTKTSASAPAFDPNEPSPFSTNTLAPSSPSTFSLGIETKKSPATSPFSLGSTQASPFGSAPPAPVFDLPPIASFGSPFSFGSQTAATPSSTASPAAAPVSPIKNPFGFSQSASNTAEVPNPFASPSPPSSTSFSIPNPFG